MKNLRLEMDGERVKIRKLKDSDARDIYKNAKDKEISKWTLNLPYPYPKDGAIKFIKKSHYNLKKKKAYTFGVVLKETDEVIGIVTLLKLDWENKNAELGYWIGKKYWNKGLMTEAVKLTLGFGFEKLKLHRICANLFEDNIGSKKVLEKSGLSLEGRLREERYKHGRWCNELKYGILAREYNH